MAHPHLEEGRGLEAEWGREIRVIWTIFHCRPLEPSLTCGRMIALNSWYGKIEKYSEVRLPAGEKEDGWLVAKVQQGALPNWFL